MVRNWERFEKRQIKRGRVVNEVRQKQILSLGQQGLTAREIGKALDPPITASGVRTALTRIRKEQP